jgi:hypothetical protein
MGESNAFERRLAAGLEAVAGPPRAVDAVAIARAAVAPRADRRATLTWRRRLPSGRLAFAGLLVAVGVAAVVAGSALLRVPTVSPGPTASASPTFPTSTVLRQSGWTPTASMREGRYLAPATVLPDGRILVAGGDAGRDGPSLSSVELYDPTARAWVDGPQMSARRSAASATMLADGRVLVAGGYDGFDATTSAEIYDPTAGTWAATTPMGEPRGDHTATLLPDGTVLVAGGRHKRSSTGSALATAEVYDPATGAWHEVAEMARGRVFHTATLLPSGKVLIAGAGLKAARFDLGVTAELYDPQTGRWTAASTMDTARGHHTATLLPDGRILVVGGNEPYQGPFHFDGWEAPLAATELYDPVTDEWTVTASMSLPRTMFAAAIAGNALVVVGNVAGSAPTSERYEVASGVWSTIDTGVEARESPLAITLLDGSVLVSGGWAGAGAALRSAGLYVAPS